MGIKSVEERLQVEVLKIDKDWEESVKEIWSISRPGLHIPPIRDVMSIDFPLTEFPGVIFKMKVPIILRELIFTLRDYTGWATTSRVENILEQWSILHSDYIREDSIRRFYPIQIEKYKERLLKGVERGDSQDVYRQNLPVSYMTSFSVKLSYRTLAKFVGYLRFHEQVPLYKGFADDIVNAVLGADPSSPIEIMAEKYVNDLLFPSPYHIRSTAASQSTANHIVIWRKIPLILRAQVVRHRYLSIVDEIGRIAQDEESLLHDVSMDMRVEISGSRNNWKRIVSSRNCWLSHTGLWFHILNSVNKHLHHAQIEIPCLDGKCPFEAETWARLSHQDPGIPCPRHIAISEHAVTRDKIKDYKTEKYPHELVTDAKREVEKNQRPKQFWLSQIQLAERRLKDS